ncbi:9873_t:CDS:2 [Cetraspora pellucida]|uniref:9873_t:CDS:1 n=1 Tax=Cetraspora pellucida TaxID=1433469 RepID=A0ACA9LVI1_9GLOM|nr:9873_t:CDS:2 [Cetraspora pellucida]
MFNTDKYFDFDLEKKTEAKSNKKKKQQQQALLLFLLAAGAAYYYFMIYLPDEERKVLEKQIQNKLEEVKNLKTEEYNNIPTLLIASDQEVRKLANILVGRYQEDMKAFPDGDKNEDFRFTRAASYDIYFPPSLQNI